MANVNQPTYLPIVVENIDVLPSGNLSLIAIECGRRSSNQPPHENAQFVGRLRSGAAGGSPFG
jgi:hypothetical protein